jgi:hypothetical protein
VDGLGASAIELPQHIMDKLNLLKVGAEPTFEIPCTLNLPQKINDVRYNYNVINDLLSQTFRDSPHTSVRPDFVSLFLFFYHYLHFYGSMDRKSPIAFIFPQSFLFSLLPTLSSVLDVFQYLVELSSGSSHRSVSFKLKF